MSSYKGRLVNKHLQAYLLSRNTHPVEQLGGDNMKHILFVFTSANRNLTGGQTVRLRTSVSHACPATDAEQGYYLPEAAHPYYSTFPLCISRSSVPRP